MVIANSSLNILPAPRFSRQGDCIFVSTIYPITTDGSVVHSEGDLAVCGRIRSRRADPRHSRHTQQRP